MQNGNHNKPPLILYRRGKTNLRSREEILQVVDQAVEVMHLKKRPAALIKYYCSCKSGFRPALKTIEQATGIPSNKISQIRNILASIGMIQREENGDWIMIDLERIALYSTLDTNMVCKTRNTKGKKMQTVRSTEKDYTLIEDPELKDFPDGCRKGKQGEQGILERLYKMPPWNGYIPDSVRWRQYNDYIKHASYQDKTVKVSDYKHAINLFKQLNQRGDQK